MTISHRARLLLYIGMAVLPIWLDWFKLTQDISFRGLAMPILASLNAAIIVALAKTSPTADTTSTTTTAVQTPDGGSGITTETVTEKQQKPEKSKK